MRLLWAVAIIAFAVDQLTKWWVMYGLDLLNRGLIDVASPYLRFVMAWNRGINFGVLASGSDVARWGLIVLSIAICAVVVWWARRKTNAWFMFGAGLVVGGALGNVVDRVRFGAVADFLNMSCCGINNPYVFNVADISIFAGAGLLILMSGDDAERTARRSD
ncbi:MAG: signal peptidase II [Pseudomonadota bacterium]